MARTLVVANLTLGGQNLAQFLEGRIKSASSTSFHLIAPVAESTMWAWGGPLASTALQPWPHTELAETARADALLRVDLLVGWLRTLGASATGEVIADDPLSAIEHTIHTMVFDDVVISTLPLGLSKWLHLDLPHRVAKHCGLPVVTVVDDFRSRRLADLETI